MTKQYILRNITKMDVNLGDLRYKIPAGKARDLLSKTARLNIEDVERSRKNGSIAARLGKSLVEVQNTINPPHPKKMMSNEAVVFPNRIKTTIVLEMDDISEDVRNLSIVDEDEFLKELDNEFEQSLPLVATNEEDATEDEDKTKEEL